MTVVVRSCRWRVLLLFVLACLWDSCHSIQNPFGVFQRRTYRKSLEQQVEMTDRQLLKARDEAAQLRNLLKLLSQTYRKASMDERKILKTREGSLKEDIAKLKIYVKEVEALRDELQALLKLEQTKVKSLEDQLRDTKNASEEMKHQYEQELQNLREKMLEESRDKLQKLQEIMNGRVQDAIRQTREEVEAEYTLKMQRAIEKEQEKTQTAEKENEVKVRRAIEKEQMKAAHQLRQERERLEQAVEKERVKMRKLVKALAVKEKAMIAEAELKHQKATTTSSPSSSKRTTVGAAMMSPIKK